MALSLGRKRPESLNGIHEIVEGDPRHPELLLDDENAHRIGERARPSLQEKRVGP